ncbi:MAG: KpsF/GutQ family sugar-phosphate isomerase [Rhodobacteraceae bacterium]|nr:KpsF/GutQ family sugar-phosphate isomerase [Paracoccaceae bacterium]
MTQRQKQVPQTNEVPAAASQSVALGMAGLKNVLDALHSDSLGPNFARALALIEACTGRLIIVGVGKSGHIGAKLASTFASTGTPSFFVHPTEASHGDLGMISRDDTVLMISMSGETRELQDILAYCKRFSLPLIALTGNADSLVAMAADAVLLLPEAREACPHNLAPTTSTLMQLALGDALAVSLVERRGFSEVNFREFHPGGSLGAGLIPLRELMLTDERLPLIAANRSIMLGLELLTEKSVGIIGVADDAGDLIGVITDGDIRRYLGKSAYSTMQEVLWDTPVTKIMSTEAITISPNKMAVEALAILQKNSISALFVLEGRKPVGVITLLTLLQAGVG